MTYRKQQRIIIAVFLAIPIILLIVFLIYPFLRLTFMSFTDWDGVLPKKNFIGLKNFVTVFKRGDVWLSLRNNMFYIITGIIQNALGLFFAVLLTSKLKGKNFFKAAIFLTYVINSAALGFMFNYIYDFEKGPLNTLVRMMGMSPIHFLSDPFLVNVSVAFVCLWRYLGYTMVIYIAALESVPNELYEASVVDGASAWQRFRYITVPSITRIIELNMFLCLSGGMQAFNEAFIMTKGGPGYASSTFLTYIVKTFTQFNSYGLAAALSLALLAIIIIVTTVQRRVILMRHGGEARDTVLKA
jgi:raffinose/stachyose/melibiose transport system permease protein